MQAVAQGASFFIGTLFAVAGVFFHWIEPLDNKLLDIQFRLLRTLSPHALHHDVVVVGIDEDTTKILAEPITLWHRHLGQFFSALVAAKPAVVGVDIVLPDRSYDAVKSSQDLALMRGLVEARRAYPLVLALTVDPAGKARQIYLPFLRVVGEGAFGFALMPLDADGVVRRFNEHLGERGEVVPTLAGQIARRLNVEPQAGLIDFARGPQLHYLPFHKVLEWHAAQDAVRLAQAFHGKVVLLGMVLKLEDRQRVPVQLAAWEAGESTTPGVLVHAQVLRSVLNRGLIVTQPRLVVIALALAAALLWFVKGRLIVLILVYLVFAVVLFIASTLLLESGVHLPVVVAALTGLVAIGARNGGEAMMQLRERRRLRSAFGGYVSPAVMREILNGRIHPELGGVNKFVCVLFSDIRGYTARSEGMEPQLVIKFLNRYFEETVAIIHKHEGSVMCFMGDGIMAVFGAPNDLDNPCANALNAARDVLEYVAKFNASQRLDAELPIEVGMGLHAGEAVIGHVGSSTRHDYTAIGDVINVASRVEALTKDTGYRLVCTSDVVVRLPDSGNLIYLGPIPLKGHSAVEVYGFDKIG